MKRQCHFLNLTFYLWRVCGFCLGIGDFGFIKTSLSKCLFPDNFKWYKELEMLTDFLTITCEGQRTELQISWVLNINKYECDEPLMFSRNLTWELKLILEKNEKRLNLTSRMHIFLVLWKKVYNFTHVAGQ